MRQRRLGWLLSILTLVAAPAPTTLVAGQGSGASRKAEAALQAAMNKETVAGDLTGAIKDYNAIVTQYGQGEQPIAAQALMRSAGAYEKLGRTEESRQVYARIAKDYANIARDAGVQKDIVALARARFAALTPAPPQAPGIRPRLVMTTPTVSLNALSADGTLAVGSSGGSLHILNLTSGQSTRLGVEGFSPVFAQDAKQIAYVRAEASGPLPRVPSLYIVSATPGAQPRTLVSREAGLVDLAPFGFSLDGKTVYANVGAMTAVRTGGQASLVSVSIADGRVTTIKAFEPRQGAIGPRLSPDGRHIAYSLASGSSDSRHIFTIDTTGQSEREVVKLAGINGNAIWSPDGAHLIFWNLSGGFTLWSVPVSNGQAVGTPSTLPSRLAGTPGLLGISPSGTLYTSQVIPNGPKVFVADRTASSSIVQMFPGESASWSFDGKTIAFLRAGESGSTSGVIIRSVVGGEERLYGHDNVNPTPLRWLHDGSGLLVRVDGPAHESTDGAIYFVDAKTGDYRLLFPKNANGHIRRIGAISLDDKTLYMLVKNDREPRSPFKGIVGVDLATGTEMPVATFPGDGFSGLGLDFGVSLALSPEGSTFAVMAAANEADVKDSRARVFAVGINGSGFRQLCGPFLVHRTANVLRWTPDGKSLLFAMANDSRVGWRIMKVPSAGGQPVFDGLDSTNFTGSLRLPTLVTGGPASIDLNPDGSRMSVEVRAQASVELWALDNVFSVLTGSR